MSELMTLMMKYGAGHSSCDPAVYPRMGTGKKEIMLLAPRPLDHQKMISEQFCIGGNFMPIFKFRPNDAQMMPGLCPDDAQMMPG